MLYRGHNVEILERGTKLGEYRRCQVAIDFTPAIPFDVHESDFLNFQSDQKRNEFLARQGMSLIETYGDARWPRQVRMPDLHPASTFGC